MSPDLGTLPSLRVRQQITQYIPGDIPLWLTPRYVEDESVKGVEIRCQEYVARYTHESSLSNPRMQTL